MEQDNAKRFDRIIAILIQLQSRKVVKAKDLSDRFGVSLRTIYRDIKSLEASGVPVLSEAGVGYSIMEGYKLPPVMFTADEAASFVAAEKLVSKYTDAALDSTFKSAMYKIKAVLRWTDKEMVASLDSSLKVSNVQSSSLVKSPSNVLNSILASITQKKQLLLHYQAFDSDQMLMRKVEPVGLYHDYNRWYMMAYCHLRKAYRQFRTDRIAKIECLSAPFEQQHENLDYFINHRTDMPKTEVKVWANVATARFVKGSCNMLGKLMVEEQVNDGCLFTFSTGLSMEDFCRLFLMFADGAKILSPQSAKVALKQIAKQLYDAVELS